MMTLVKIDATEILHQKKEKEEKKKNPSQLPAQYH